MCGIAGIIDKSGKIGPARLGQLAKEAADRMRHRGPDDCGLWVSPDGRCALSHRRLSIIDVSSAGHQPMVSKTGRSVIVFNGEAYNFVELKRELEARGAAFRSSSDTEVLLEMLELEGQQALVRLDAMFALGCYDTERGELLLARDIFGEKPLYYVELAIPARCARDWVDYAARALVRLEVDRC